MNNNKMFMVFVVALLFGFSLSVGLKSADLSNAIRVYESFKHTVQDDDLKFKFQAKRSAFIRAINQVLNHEAVLSSSHRNLVLSVLKVTDIKAAQALMRKFIDDKFPDLRPPSAGPVRPSRVTAATSATTGRRRARAGASAAGSAAAVSTHHTAAAACAGPARTASAIPQASAAVAASACDVAMAPAAAAAAPVQPSACAAFRLSPPITASYLAMIRTCGDAVPRVVPPRESALAAPSARLCGSGPNPVPTLPPNLAAWRALEAARLEEGRRATADDVEPPVVPGPVPSDRGFTRIGDPAAWGIPSAGFVRAAQPYRPAALPPVASAAAADEGAESSDSDGPPVVPGSGLLRSGRPIC